MFQIPAISLLAMLDLRLAYMYMQQTIKHGMNLMPRLSSSLRTANLLSWLICLKFNLILIMIVRNLQLKIIQVFEGRFLGILFEHLTYMYKFYSYWSCYHGCNRAVICQKQISVEGNGHCCHRPSSNWETNQHRAVIIMPKTNFCRGQRPLLS